MKSYVVVGLGRFGMEAAKQLCAMGGEVLAIDNGADTVQQIAPDVTHAVVADARDKEVLRALGVADFDCAIVAIGDSLTDSVLATMNLLELGVPHLVCKAYDETHCQILKKLGAHQVLVPEKEQAVRLARSLSNPNVLDYIELSGDHGIIEVPAPKIWQGKTLKELNVRAKVGVNIIAVKHGEEINVSPAADYRIGKEDVMVMLGDTIALEKVQKL
jgi:trk system potassium uptake protein TrkA